MMIHKIEPHKYYPEFRNQEPKPSDYLLLFDGEKVYLPSHTGNDAAVAGSSANAGIVKHSQVYLPTFEEVHGLLGIRQLTVPQSGPASARSADRSNIPRSLRLSLSPSWIPCRTRFC